KLKPELYPTGKPVSTWVFGFDYTLPLPGDVDDPSRWVITPGAKAGSELKKANVFTLWTAFSKRYRVLEPYVRAYAKAPLAVRGAGYDNCSHTNLLADV